MSGFNRRTFLQQVGAAAALPAFGGLGAPFTAGPNPAAAQSAAQAPALYDLLIQGGRVIDPAQKISAVRDLAIAGGRIARIADNIPAAQARQVYNAAGK